MRPPRPPLPIFFATAACVALLGGPLGLIWAALAPRPNYVNEGNGFFSAYTAIFGVDVTFALVSLVGGLVAGLLTYLLARRAFGSRLGAFPHSIDVPAGLAVGALGAALSAARVGTLSRGHALHRLLESYLAGGSDPAAVHQLGTEALFSVHAYELIAVLPLLALAGYLIGIVLRPDLGPRRAPLR